MIFCLRRLSNSSENYAQKILSSLFLVTPLRILQRAFYTSLEEMANLADIKSLRKENDHLKKQLQELPKDFENVKSKMAEQRRYEASP